jgi:hypothetical protein
LFKIGFSAKTKNIGIFMQKLSTKIRKKQGHLQIPVFSFRAGLWKKNSKFAACKKKVQKILAYIGSIHYLCCKKEEPACWRGKLEEKPGQAQAGYQSSQLRCKL